MFTIYAKMDEDGQFVVIPKEIAFDDIDMDFEITRNGDVITIRPASKVAAGAEAPRGLDRNLVDAPLPNPRIPDEN